MRCRASRVAAWALLAAAVVVVTGAPAAPAAPGFRVVGAIDNSPAVGWSEIAWRTNSDVIRYRDSRTRRQADIGASGCFPYDVRAKRVLLGCERPSGRPEPRIADLGTGEVQAVPGADPSDFYLGLGLYWLLGSSCSINPPNACGTVSLNWRTGERVSYAVDTDSPTATPAASEKPKIRLVGRERGSPPRRVRLAMRRSGRPDLLLSRCRGGCFEAQYSFGRAGWIQGRRVHGYDPSTHRRRSWAIPQRVQRGKDLGLRLNGYEAILFAASPGAPQHGEMFVVSWPR